MTNNAHSTADPTIRLYLLGQTRTVHQTGDTQEESRIQPKPFHLLAYLALNHRQPHRRETLQALFWPDKPPHSAANNLRQALWHLRQPLPANTLHIDADQVRWNPASPPWVDALAFDAALDADDLDSALALYAGPLLPDAYDEWVQLERERLHLRYLTALESRAHHHYETQNWSEALTNVETLLTADLLNEAAARLAMACHWALGQREAARRSYQAYRDRLRHEMDAAPLPETTALYHRILRGEAHPDQATAPVDTITAGRVARLSLLETLGAFNQGLEGASAWAAQADGNARAMALRWQGRFYLRLGQLKTARQALTDALSLSDLPGVQAVVLADLATTETGLGDYASAEAHYVRALELSPLNAGTRLRLLSSLGGLQGRMGFASQARLSLDEAVRLARDQQDPAPLAIASGNLGILLIGQGEPQAAEVALTEALDAAHRADAHWLTAHVTGHLGVLAQDRKDLEQAADYYQRARLLAETIGDQRSATLWTMNLGVVRYEQGRCAEAVTLLAQGRRQAQAQGVRSLVAGANIFIGACLVAQNQAQDGLDSIQEGLALAEEIGDRERSLIGHLHQGRALIALDRIDQARATLQEGLRQAETSKMHRFGEFLRAELQSLPPSFLTPD